MNVIIKYCWKLFKNKIFVKGRGKLAKQLLQCVFFKKNLNLLIFRANVEQYQQPEICFEIRKLRLTHSPRSENFYSKHKNANCRWIYLKYTFSEIHITITRPTKCTYANTRLSKAYKNIFFFTKTLYIKYNYPRVSDGKNRCLEFSCRHSRTLLGYHARIFREIIAGNFQLMKVTLGRA